MHYIGNRAIVLTTAPQGSTSHISYSSGFTAVSFFLPISVLLLAFYLLGLIERLHLLSVVALAGALTGAAICGMHYVGQQGIENFNCHYRAAYVAGAATIAIIASILALSLFFLLRAYWTDTGWKRSMCATLLAAAVSGMHWTATVGTSYSPKARQQPTKELSPKAVVIVCTILSLTSCALLLILAVIARRRGVRFASRAHQLVLACAFFDSDGRIMVTSDDLLPNHKIMDHYIERTFADRFSKTHPAFIWAFRATHDWPKLGKLIPRMKAHLLSDKATRHSSCWQDEWTSHDDDGSELAMGFDRRFKELFCVAAQGIADQVHQSLNHMGVLFEDPLTTGTYPKTRTSTRTVLQRWNPFTTTTTASSDLENGDTTPDCLGSGGGQFFFLVRQLTKPEATSIAAGGFRFAAIQKIAPLLARKMQVTPPQILDHLARMQQYSWGKKMMEPGLYLVGFSLWPRVRSGCEVLVLKNAPNLLPFASLLAVSTNTTNDHLLHPWQQEILSHLDQWTLSSCLAWLQANSVSSRVHAGVPARPPPPQAARFCRQMHQAISNLAATIHDPTFGQAQFACQPIRVPCRSSTSSSCCSVLSFHIVMPLNTQPTSPELALEPLCFFKAQQQVYAGVADHYPFVADLHREFAAAAESDSGGGGGFFFRLFSLACCHSANTTPPTPPPTTSNSWRTRRSTSSAILHRVWSGFWTTSTRGPPVPAREPQRDEWPLQTRPDLGLLPEGHQYYSRTFVDELCCLLCRTRGNRVHPGQDDHETT
jgi:NO-binding membrane sensor protein with MHYT domain